MFSYLTWNPFKIDKLILVTHVFKNIEKSLYLLESIITRKHSFLHISILNFNHIVIFHLNELAGLPYFFGKVSLLPNLILILQNSFYIS